MNRIHFGASRDVFAAGLNQVFEDELLSASGQIRGYGLNPDDYFNVDKDKKKKKKKEGTEDTFDPLNILPGKN